MQGFQQLQEDWKGPSWGRSQEGRPGETQNASLWALMSVGDVDSELNQPNERNEEEARASQQHKWHVQRLGGGGGLKIREAVTEDRYYTKLCNQDFRGRVEVCTEDSEITHPSYSSFLLPRFIIFHSPLGQPDFKSLSPHSVPQAGIYTSQAKSLALFTDIIFCF